MNTSLNHSAEAVYQRKGCMLEGLKRMLRRVSNGDTVCRLPIVSVPTCSMKTKRALK